jgi:hypothetical protein
MACWIVFGHYFIVTQSYFTINLFIHCLHQTIMSTRSTSNIAHINMPPNAERFFVVYIKPPWSALTPPMLVLPTLTIPPMLSIFVATDYAIVKHVLDRITIIFRALFDLHTRYFVW